MGIPVSSLAVAGGKISKSHHLICFIVLHCASMLRHWQNSKLFFREVPLRHGVNICRQLIQLNASACLKMEYLPHCMSIVHGCVWWFTLNVRGTYWYSASMAVSSILGQIEFTNKPCSWGSWDPSLQFISVYPGLSGMSDETVVIIVNVSMLCQGSKPQEGRGSCSSTCDKTFGFF